VTNPSFLLLDEPFSGIDPIVVAEAQEIIKDLKKKGLGILLTDHNVRETLSSLTGPILSLTAGFLFPVRPRI